MDVASALSTTPAAPADAPAAKGWWRFPVLLFVFTRAGLLAFSRLCLSFKPEVHQGGRDPFLQPWPALDGLCRWDCGWFKVIAETGYDPGNGHTANFWPLYPMLTRAVAFVTGLDVHYALILVANLAGLGALLVIYRVYLHFADEPAARWALLVFVAFPFHFFQAAAYPESLMVALSAASFWLALKRHHLLAGLVLGGGILARHITVLFGLGLAAVQLRQRGQSLRTLLWSRSVLGLALVFLPPLGFMLFQQQRYGDPLAFWRARDMWGASAWYSILAANDLRHTSYMLAALLPTFGAVLCGWRPPWRELAAAAVPLLLVLWAVGLEGLGRYAASVWPAYLPLGVLLSRWPMGQSVFVGVSFLLQGQFFWLYAHQYPVL